MRILLVNDDGIFAEGINILAKELTKNHEVYICAPKGEQSGMSQALSVGIPLRVKVENLPISVKKAFSIDGRPADCTKLALEVLLKDEQIDMVISGINKGANLGTDVLYSGTVGAALEGYNHKMNCQSKCDTSFKNKLNGLSQFKHFLGLLFNNINFFIKSSLDICPKSVFFG